MCVCVRACAYVYVCVFVRVSTVGMSASWWRVPCALLNRYTLVSDGLTMQANVALDLGTRVLGATNPYLTVIISSQFVEWVDFSK